MLKCSLKTIQVSRTFRRNIEAKFSGGSVTSDGGILLLRELDRKIGLTKEISKVIPDNRHQSYVLHKLEPLLKQRIYGIATGYEDLNDHQTLRHDIAFQTAVDRDDNLGSMSTLSRFENTADRETVFLMHQVFIEQFISTFKSSPKELILDFDPTDDLVHGNQENRFFHGYYKEYCFLPLYVFCNDQLLVSYLRPSNIDGAKHSWAILSLLVKRFRKEWPEVKIIFRGDSGFCRHRMFSWCENNNVYYIVGIGKNNCLLKLSSAFTDLAKEQYEEKEEKQKLFGEFKYSAKTWNKDRRIIVKAEYLEKGPNPRFIITNLEGDPKELYEKTYCARGDIENRIKEQQLDLFADRTSCHNWCANQFRLMLSSCAYILISQIRRIALQATEFANAQCGTIRLKLFKIGAVIIRNTRRIKFLLSNYYPYQDLFMLISNRLCPE